MVTEKTEIECAINRCKESEISDFRFPRANSGGVDNHPAAIVIGERQVIFQDGEFVVSLD